jgi:hypothetical protein
MSVGRWDIWSMSAIQVVIVKIGAQTELYRRGFV